MKGATSATIIFHGPAEDRPAGARAVRAIAKAFDGHYTCTSFWSRSWQRWHSPETEGLVAHAVAVPVQHYRAAVQMARAITKDPSSNVWHTHHWSAFWATQPKKRKKNG